MQLEGPLNPSWSYQMPTSYDATQVSGFGKSTSKEA